MITLELNKGLWDLGDNAFKVKFKIIYFSFGFETFLHIFMISKKNRTKNLKFFDESDCVLLKIRISHQNHDQGKRAINWFQKYIWNRSYFEVAPDKSRLEDSKIKIFVISFLLKKLFRKNEACAQLVSTPVDVTSSFWIKILSYNKIFRRIWNLPQQRKNNFEDFAV